MDIKKIFFKIVIILLLGSCSNQNYTKQESVYIVFKTPTFKYADLGFIYKNKDALKVELYSAGQPMMRLEVVDSSVCMSLFECMNKKSFNKKVLSEYYPDNLMNNIFKGKNIFSAKNIQNTRNGFTQKISKSSKYSITYSVLGNQIIFRDRINSILIKIKRM